MSNLQYFDCPYCRGRTLYEVIEEIYPLKLICCHCYRPLTQHAKNGPIRRRRETISKAAFLIHSSKSEDRNLLNWFRKVLRLYGISTYIVEEDNRSIDFLQKSADGIEKTDFVVVLLTKRYLYINDSDQLGWKGPDKCYDEISMSFMRGRDLFALIEEDVDPGRVLERVAWYGVFRQVEENIEIRSGHEFFQRIDLYVENVELPLTVIYKL